MEWGSPPKLLQEPTDGKGASYADDPFLRPLCIFLPKTWLVWMCANWSCEFDGHKDRAAVPAVLRIKKPIQTAKCDQTHLQQVATPLEPHSCVTLASQIPCSTLSPLQAVSNLDSSCTMWITKKQPVNAAFYRYVTARQRHASKPVHEALNTSMQVRGLQSQSSKMDNQDCYIVLHM